MSAFSPAAARDASAPALALRPYQQAALKAIHAAEARGIKRQLVQMPTGTGKTVLFAHLISQRSGRAMVLAHRDELLGQAADKLRAVLPGAQLGKVKAEHDEHDAPIVVASVQTLSRAERLARVVPDFATVVVDECHHAAAESYRRVLEHLRAFEPDGPLVLGVTATPSRGDGQGLDDVFQEIVFEASILDMIRAGYLSDLRAKQIRLEADFSSLHIRRGDFVDAEVERAMFDADGPAHVAEAWREHAKDRRGLVFATTVRLAHAIAEELVEAGIAAEGLDGSTPEDERRAILRRLRTGESSVICNCAVLSEGFDEPAIDCIAIARPTRSKLLYQQMLGRGTRRWPGKLDCLVLDFVGATSRHDLLTVASLFGVEPQAVDGEGLVEAVDARARADRVTEGRLVARDVDLFQTIPMAWVRLGPQRFVIGIGDGQLELRQEADRFAVFHRRRGERWPEVLGAAPTLELALGIAEDAVRRLRAENLVRPDAPWRSRPATEKQLAALRRLRVAAPAQLTAGEASELLTAAIAAIRHTRSTA